jgi:uncharacterized protein (DUF58 family)
MARLFTEEFVSVISRLRIVSSQVPRGGRHAEQRSVQPGAGMEFRDFRAYMPGDDIRRIDWNFYRRSGRLFLRLFEELQNLPVYVLLDVSDSMFFETPPRADAARQMAAAFAAAALNQHDSPSLFPFGSDFLPPLRTLSGRTGLTRTLDYLENLKPAGPTHIARALGRFAAWNLRRGLVVLISDFFDPRGIEPVVDTLKTLRHRLVVVQTIRPADAEPDMTGQLRLIDCEGGRDIDVAVTGRTLARYRQAYEAFMDGVLKFVAQRRAGYVALDVDQPLLDQLGEIFVDGALVTRG